MRRAALLLATLAIPALAACDPGERAAAAGEGRAEQATIVDGRADAVFGQPDLFSGAAPLSTTRNSLRYPEGLALDPTVAAASQIVWIADRGANRGLGLPPGATMPAYLAGQSDFTLDAPNAGGDIGPIGVSGPSAFAVAFGQLAFVDTGNHRVLFGYYGGFPFYPSAVFGQHGAFDRGNRNDGGAVTEETLADPGGATFDWSFSPGRLVVADTGNHRVVVFGITSPMASTAALFCIGQLGCDAGLPNRGGAPTAESLSAPQGVAWWHDPKNPSDPLRGLYVADTGNHRVLHFNVFSSKADLVYGQGGDFGTAAPAKGGPSAASLRNPAAVAVDPDGSLWIADTGHHRVLHFPKGTPVADRVLGQPDFTTVSAPPGPSPTTLRAPAGLAVSANGDLWVADTGHSRLLRYVKPCDPTTCDDGNPCTDARCDPKLGCVHDWNTYSRSCAPYSCDFTSRTCQKPCNSSRPCAPRYTCDNGKCAARCGPSLPCPEGGPCVDGWCCDKACDGPCETCNQAGFVGECRPVREGPPPPSRTCAGPTGDCGMRCNGFDGSRCGIAQHGTPCGAEACTDGVAIARGQCDGTGQCTAKPRTCAPFACAESGCYETCLGDHHCAGSARCVGGGCVELADLQAGGGCGVALRARGAGGAAAILLLALVLVRRRAR
ncbi:MAG: NHL repeat-containing protein [Deltaproteobacteria bacterium]|nr:NHL repeat-containing protein [Deltaproteobacteria bacterium]